MHREHCLEKRCDELEAIVRELAAATPVIWTRVKWGGWDCILCNAFAERGYVRAEAAPMRDGEHAESCLWRRARALVEPLPGDRGLV